MSSAEYRARERDRIREADLAYYAANREKIRERQRAYSAARYAEKRDAILRLNASWREVNRDRVKVTASDYARRNRAKLSARCAAYRARILRAIPAWADITAIESVYAEARNRKMEVDHVVPLLSKFVCGFHCEANLRVIGPDENRAKGNRYWPGMW